MNPSYAELSDRANRFKPTDASPPRFVVNKNQELIDRVIAIKAIEADNDERNVWSGK